MTRNTVYTLIDQGDGAFLVSGNETFFPQPTCCTLYEAPKVGESMWIKRGTDQHRIVTSPVQGIIP